MRTALFADRLVVAGAAAPSSPTITSMSRAARRWRRSATASPATPRPAASRLPVGSRCRRRSAPIMTPNITPDDATGIGRWIEGQFRPRRCMRARRPDGTYLYPAFPYPYYTKVTRQDVDAIYDLSAHAGAGVECASIAIRCRSRSASAIVDARLERAVLYARLFRADPRTFRGIQPRRLSGRRSRPLRRLPHAR